MVQTEAQYVFIHDAILEYLGAMENEVRSDEIREYIREKSVVDATSGIRKT